MLYYISSYLNAIRGDWLTKKKIFLLQSVKSQRLTERAKDLKDNSNDLLTEAGRADEDLKSKICVR